MTYLPTFKIGDFEIEFIQGGMGVGISLSGLASAVANCGGMGVIASVAIGLLKGYHGDYARANQNALRDEIRATRKLTNGVIGVNIMYALTDFEELVEAAVKEDINAIICGAGVSKHLPKLVKDTVGDKPISLVPIVSSKQAARVITYYWRKHGRVPDAVIVEGHKAGGHLGFKYDELVAGNVPDLEVIVKEVIDFVKSDDFLMYTSDNPVPVIAAGGIYTGGDIAKYLELGVAGVQMATRFVTTKECDAHHEFKMAYLNAKEKDIKIIESPVGLPGRAIITPFLKRVIDGEQIEFGCKFQCLKTCDPSESSYCIAEALIGAQKGNFDKGFVFAGSNAYRATHENCLGADGNFISVKTLMERIAAEYQRSLQ